MIAYEPLRRTMLMSSLHRSPDHDGARRRRGTATQLLVGLAMVSLSVPIARSELGMQPEMRHLPLIVDVAGDGFRLTSVEGGISYDLTGSGARQIGWTAAGADDSFLVLGERDRRPVTRAAQLLGVLFDGMIGFDALRLLEHDMSAHVPAIAPTQSLLSDAQLDDRDPLYHRLLLWTDSDHDGKSSASEIRSPREAGLERLYFGYYALDERDQYGNQFLFGAQALVRQGGYLKRTEIRAVKLVSGSSPNDPATR